MSTIYCSPSVQAPDASPLPEQNGNSPDASRPARKKAVRHGRVSKSGDTATTTLACNPCRQKKVKCVIEENGCRRCNRLGVDCAWPSQDQRKCPSSKTHIRALEDRIASLEAALAAATATLDGITAQQPMPMDMDTATAAWAENAENCIPSPILSIPIPEPQRAPSIASVPSQCSVPSHDEDDNIISRLCGRQWKLNSDEEGQYKFFGPTSSLHLTESVSSSLASGCPHRLPEDTSVDGIIDHDTHLHLLDTYWTYQHTILQIFDREEFLEGLKKKQGKYYSKGLLYAIYACAARISDRPHLRAMVVPPLDDLNSQNEPPLVTIATKLVNKELERPRVTTIQALLLMSVIYCSLGKDTQGWLSAGVACSLAIDFGLHRYADNLTTSKMSERDIKVRQITYWGCLVFDRFWAQYLGRPVTLRGEDHQARLSAPLSSDTPWESKLAFAWVSLLMIVGNISDALNRVDCTPEMLQALDAQLQDWYGNLDSELLYSPTSPPSVTLLHMEYYSSKIHLHRPTANFGSSLALTDGQDSISRTICIENAENLASAITDYRILYGDVSTMSGIGLHMIATAATILIANIAEKGSKDTSRQMHALQTCIRGLCDLEKTYRVARRVRRVIRLILGLCHVDISCVTQPLQDLDSTAGTTRAEGHLELFGCSEGVDDLTFADPAADMMNLAMDPASLWTEELPAASGYRDFDIVYNLGSFL